MSTDERTLADRVASMLVGMAALLREQQAEIEKCMRLIKTQADGLDVAAATMREMEDYIEYLDVQNHRLRCDAETDLRDAERYRWLRGDLCEDHSHRWTQWEVRCWKAPRWTDDLRREDLDAAIDLARARGEGER